MRLLFTGSRATFVFTFLIFVFFLAYITTCFRFMRFVTGKNFDICFNVSFYILPSFTNVTTYDRVGLMGIATRFSKLCVQSSFHGHNHPARG